MINGKILQRMMMGAGLILSFSFLAKAYGECNAPDAGKISEITSYVMNKYQIASASTLMLKTSAKANDTCFWKVEYNASSPQRNIVLYLSPDRKYLTPLLFDMALDPLVEMRTKDEELSQELTKGGSTPLGDPKSPVTIVEFSDFECPFCKRMADTLEKEVMTKEGGKVHVVYRYFPLPMHPWAKDAAEIAECVQMQQPEAFWAMHDYFFQNQQNLHPDDMKQQAMTFATTLKGIDQKQFSSCVDRELALGPVTQDQQLGQKMGVRGTPALYINGVRFDGARSGDEINRLVEQAVRGELVSPPDAQVPASSTASPRVQQAAAQCEPLARSSGVRNAQ